MLICHNCGTPIENRVRQCHHCHNFVSSYAAVNIAESQISHPLKIEFEIEPAILNRLMAKELIKANYLVNERPGNGNSGNGSSGNGSSENGHSSNGQDKDISQIAQTGIPAQTETLNNKDNYFLSLQTDEI